MDFHEVEQQLNEARDEKQRLIALIYDRTADWARLVALYKAEEAIRFWRKMWATDLQFETIRDMVNAEFVKAELQTANPENKGQLRTVIKHRAQDIDLYWRNNQVDDAGLERHRVRMLFSLIGDWLKAQ